jgi:hypothetical protein
MQDEPVDETPESTSSEENPGTGTFDTTATDATPPRCDCPALEGPHVHLPGGPAPLEAS